MQYSKKMGLDYGKSRIGVAFSNLFISSADHIYKTKTEEEDLAYFSNLIDTRGIELVVFGLPLNADASECEMTQVVRDFASKLQAKTGVEIAFQDERFTSYEAEELLKEAKIKWENRKQFLDKVAAQIILQNYMDQNPTK